MNPTRRNQPIKNENHPISPAKERKDLDNAFQSSSGFANPYGEEDAEEEGTIEKLSPEDDEFDFGLLDLDEDDEDIEQFKKSFRH